MKKTIGQVLGCLWQGCTVHFLREALGHARREQQPVLAALIRPIFDAEDGEQASRRLGSRRNTAWPLRVQAERPTVEHLGGTGPSRR